MKKSSALIIFVLLMLASCSPSPEAIEQALAQTQTACAFLSTNTPTITATPTETSTQIPTNTPSPSDIPVPTHTGDEFRCGEYFTIAVLEPPIFASVIEDNPPYYPIGIFMIVKIRLVNETDSYRWVWYNNYFMQGLVNGKLVLYQIDGVDDASNALEKMYKTNPYQAEIGPGVTYDTMVAFDVNPEGENWILTVMPDQLCDVKIPLENN